MKERISIQPCTPWGYLIGVWLVSRLLVYFIGYMAFNTIQVNDLPNLSTEIGHAVQGIWYGVLARWDTNWYFYIADKGYTGILWAFFPLYPLSVRVLKFITVDRMLVITVMQNLMFLAILWLLFKIASEEWDESVGQSAVLAAVFFPLSFYFSAPYTESLSIILILMSYYLAKKGLWLTAFIAGALAGVTRVTGCLVGILLLAEFYRQYINKKVLGAKIFGFLLLPLGVVFYILFLKEKAGDPWAFLQAQKAWMRTPSVGNLWFLKNPGTSLELFFTIFYLGLVGYLLAIRRWAYALYTFLFLAIPISTGTLMSMPRLGMNAFPVFLALGVIINRSETVKFLSVGIGAAYLAYFTALFSLWYWVA